MEGLFPYALKPKAMIDAADEFLTQAKLRDPERYAELEDQYPIITSHAKRRDRRGEVYRPIEQRGPLSKSAKQRYRDQRAARKAALRELALDIRLAEEAQQGYY